MTHSEGVPLTRELLEALTGLAAEVQRDHLTRPTGSRAVAAAAGQLATHCAAALAPDAGTPEGEPFFHRLGCPKISGRGTAAHCTCPHELRAMTDAEMSASQTAAPLAESGPAAPPTNAPEISTSLVDAAPDAELDRLLSAYYRAMVAFGATPGTVQGEAMADARAAIHAYVERVKREAREELVAQKDGAYRERDMCVALLAQLASQLGYPVGMARHEGEWEDDWRWIVYIELPAGQVSWHIHDSERHWFDAAAYRGKWDGHSTDEKYRRVLSVKNRAPAPAPAPAPGDASGETADNFEAALRDYVEAALDCAAHDSNQPYERLRGRRELARQKVWRLYRAATGEVVCTGYLRHMKDRIIELRGAVLTNRDWFTDLDGVPVDLVLRRDKEGRNQ